MVELSHRARRILQAVVSEYTSSGEAVGSRTVTKRHGIDLSAATVRNVMADLEDAGLLRQPHTSAGRVPTPKGLRYFIDTLLKVRCLSPPEKDEVRSRFDTSPVEVQETMRDASKVLSDLSRHAALVLAPRMDIDVLEHLRFVPLRSGAVLAIVVTKRGLVQNRLIPVEFALTPGDLDRIHNYLNQLLEGLTLEEVRARVLEEIQREQNRLDRLIAHALHMGAQALQGGSAPEMIVEGQSNLLDREVDTQRIKAMLRALEEKQLLVRLLEGTASAPGVRVFIGAELHIAELEDCSVVAASYGSEERPLGTLGVVGPVHMNYSKVIPLVDFTAEIISEVLSRHGICE